MGPGVWVFQTLMPTEALQATLRRDENVGYGGGETTCGAEEHWKKGVTSHKVCGFVRICMLRGKEVPRNQNDEQES